MPNLEWDCPQTIKSRFGDIDLNATDSETLLRYQVLPEGYAIVPALRVTQQNLSQQDGAQMYPRWKSGMVVTLTVRFQQLKGASSGEYEPACGADLQAMSQRLSLWLNAMRDQTSGDSQRFVWTPTGEAARMLANVQVLAWPAPTFGDDTGPEPEVSFALESPFPYAVDESDTTTTVAAGDSEEFLNDGSADVWPVIKVTSPGSSMSPVTAFTITNELSGLVLEYDSTRPGAAAFGPIDYAEIDFFRGSIFRNGDGADLIPGVVPSTTDFFTITAELTDPNELSIVGADMEVTWAKAYS